MWCGDSLGSGGPWCLSISLGVGSWLSGSDSLDYGMQCEQLRFDARRLTGWGRTKGALTGMKHATLGRDRDGRRHGDMSGSQPVAR